VLRDAAVKKLMTKEAVRRGAQGGKTGGFCATLRFVSGISSGSAGDQDVRYHARWLVVLERR
jgi:hypothetical protein